MFHDDSFADRLFIYNIKSFLKQGFLKQGQNLKMSSAANFGWCFKGILIEGLQEIQ